MHTHARRHACTLNTLSLCIHPLDGHLGCFHILVIVDNAAVSVRVGYLFKSVI